MKVHNKKLIQPFFDEVWDGKKMFELRKNDCNYAIGDSIVLKEYDPIANKYTWREVEAVITCILQDYEGLEEGYCILGIVIYKTKERGAM